MAEEKNVPSQQNMDIEEEQRLKYLEFVQVATIHVLLCFHNLYGYAKAKSGPLKPGVESVEGTVKNVVGPVYDKYHGLPIELLKFIDRKVDESVTKLDCRVPPVLKQVPAQALSAAQMAPVVARSVASEVKTAGVAGTASGMAKSVYTKYEPAAKELYSKYEPKAEQYAVSAWRKLNQMPLFPQVAQVVVPTAAYCSEKYNQTVVERSATYNEHRPDTPPPDLPSLLLHGRIVYIGMPLVPAVTELVVAELMYLQWMDPKAPIYLYINSTGTTRDDGESVGMESEGFAIYDTLMQMKCEVHTVAVGAAIGMACLLLAAGTKGKRFMMPHAKIMIQQPRLPSSGLLPASDVLIRAKEAMVNRDTLVKLLAKHTGNSEEFVTKTIRRPYHMDSRRAKEFGVIDKVLWRGQETIMAEVAPPEEWDKSAGIKVVDKFGL